MKVVVTMRYTDDGIIPADAFDDFIGCGMRLDLSCREDVVTLLKASVAADGKSVDCLVDIPPDVMGGPN